MGYKSYNFTLFLLPTVLIILCQAAKEKFMQEDGLAIKAFVRKQHGKRFTIKWASFPTQSFKIADMTGMTTKMAKVIGLGEYFCYGFAWKLAIFSILKLSPSSMSTCEHLVVFPNESAVINIPSHMNVADSKGNVTRRVIDSTLHSDDFWKCVKERSRSLITIGPFMEYFCYGYMYW